MIFTKITKKHEKYAILAAWGVFCIFPWNFLLFDEKQGNLENDLQKLKKAENQEI